MEQAPVALDYEEAAQDVALELDDTGPTFLAGWYRNIEEAACIFLVAGILVTVTMGVISRSAAASPLTWTEPLARYMLVWLTFLGSVVLVKRRAHIAVDVVTSRFSGRRQAAVLLVVSAIELVVFAYITYYGWRMVQATTSTTTVPGITQQHVYAAAPVSTALMFLYRLASVPGLARTMRERGK